MGEAASQDIEEVAREAAFDKLIKDQEAFGEAREAYLAAWRSVAGGRTRATSDLRKLGAIFAEAANLAEARTSYVDSLGKLVGKEVRYYPWPQEIRSEATTGKVNGLTDFGDTAVTMERATSWGVNFDSLERYLFPLTGAPMLTFGDQPVRPSGVYPVTHPDRLDWESVREALTKSELSALA